MTDSGSHVAYTARISQEDGALTGLFLGEIKYSRTGSTITGGLEELLEYFELACYNGEYILVEDGPSIDWLQGGLFVDHLEDSIHQTEDIVFTATEDGLTKLEFKCS